MKIPSTGVRIPNCEELQRDFFINGFSKVREKSKISNCSVGSKNRYAVAHGHYLKYIFMDLAWFGSLLMIFCLNVFQQNCQPFSYWIYCREYQRILAEKHFDRKSPVNTQTMQDPWICILDNVHAQLHTIFRANGAIWEFWFFANFRKSIYKEIP